MWGLTLSIVLNREVPRWKGCHGTIGYYDEARCESTFERLTWALERRLDDGMITGDAIEHKSLSRFYLPFLPVFFPASAALIALDLVKCNTMCLRICLHCLPIFTNVKDKVS